MKQTIYYLSVLSLVCLFFFTGCEKKESDPVPTASFTASSMNPEVGEAVEFTNSSLNATSYEWDFDDGGTSTSTNPTHTFTESGTFTVELTANGAGGTHSTTKDIVVSDPEPVAEFSCKSAAYADEVITFTNSSENATSYSWSFGDGGTSTAQNPTHAYSVAGVFTVTLTATGPGGENSTSKDITITYQSPVAGFIMSPTTAEVGTEISFTNSSVHAASYSWDFGDGGTSTASDPKHTYTTEGTYTVTLTATGPGGVDDEAQDIIITPIQENLVEPGDHAGIFILGDNMGVHDAKLPDQPKQHLYASSGGIYLHWYRYLTTGIGFWTFNTSPNLYVYDIPYGINCEEPFNGITDKGIKCGNTFTQVSAAYGPPDNINSYGDYIYSKIGIEFWANTAKTNVEDIYIEEPSGKKSTQSLHNEDFEDLIRNGNFKKVSTGILK